LTHSWSLVYLSSTGKFMMIFLILSKLKVFGRD
jgi:hypothetical protein